MLSKCILWLLSRRKSRSCGFATTTVGAVYNHSKAICDRLNNSSLENIITINLNGYEVILVELRKSQRTNRICCEFSIQQLAATNNFSYWNIEQYPQETI
jgi:hypothetical protein